MEAKEELKKVLEDLETLGLTRRKIELELGYSENYLDQQVSRGKSNKKLLTALDKLKQQLLEKATYTLERKGEAAILFRDLEERIIVLEAGVEVLVQSLVEAKHHSTGRSVAEISLDLKKTMKAAAQARFDELNKK